MSNQTKVHTKMRCINQAAGDDLITKQPSPVHPNDHHFWWNLWNFGVPSTTGLTTVYLRSLTHVNRIQDAFCSPDIEDSARAALPSCCTLCGRLSGLEGLFFVGCNPLYTYLLLLKPSCWLVHTLWSQVLLMKIQGVWLIHTLKSKLLLAQL